MSLPLALAGWAEQRFLKIDPDTGLLVVNGGGFIHTYITGTSTPLATYTNAVPTLVAQQNPIELDEDGRPPSPIYTLGRSYKFVVTDADANVLYTVDPVCDIGATFLSTQGQIQTEGTTATGAGPYVVVATDNLVIVDTATNPYVVQLPLAADRGAFLVVKNLSAVTVRITPQAGEEIENGGASTYYSLAAASGALNPTVTLASDGVSAWWITGGIGV